MYIYKIIILIWLILLPLLGCENKQTDTNEPQISELNDGITQPKEDNVKVSEAEIKLIEQNSDLVDIQKIDSSLRIDLKYATNDNFMGQVLYTDIDKVYLQKEVALMLKKANQYLIKLHPSYRLLVYDGVRPRSVQQKMWDALDSIPITERTKFVSNPKNGSIHNYGCAVDLTIVDINGTILDMGAGYDDIRKIAYPKFEAQFLAEKLLSEAQVDNRKLLRLVMKKGGFYNIPTEWWHFNAFTREEARRRYKIVE